MKQVILLHGLIRTKYSMAYIALRLRQAGFITQCYGYPSRKLPIEEQAARLREFLHRTVTPGATISVVAHSLGSIITRRFIHDFAKDYSIERVVMIGPPNNGSKYAAMIHKNIPFIDKILGPAFVELTDLKMPASTHNIEIGVIAGGRGKDRGYSPLVEGDNDGIVSVEETKLDGSKDTITLPALHSIMIYYPAVIRQTIAFLNTGAFDRGRP